MFNSPKFNPSIDPYVFEKDPEGVMEFLKLFDRTDLLKPFMEQYPEIALTGLEKSRILPKVDNNDSREILMPPKKLSALQSLALSY